ncbi:DUF3987 domain-containing protein [Cyclobacterium xiamenense]|uniref:DUF3987 domain-containing protein n=1 Tax=Cyclobacterium xiamenense TaxID=1297121 RepID=UPI0035CF9FD2
MKKTFNPLDWLSKPNTQTTDTQIIDDENNHGSYNYDEVSTIIDEIEANKVDIAPEYADWRNIGFAFADAFGETGRELYLRTSRFYPGFNEVECNEQYDKCLRSSGEGIKLNTFFYLAKKAGISLSRFTFEEQKINKPLTIPPNVYSQLPDFLQKVVVHAVSDEERDILLLGSLVTLSSCMPNIYGIYHGKKVFANLYLFVTAQASAGKGNLAYCRRLVLPIHKKLREEFLRDKEKYELDLMAYNIKKDAKKEEKPSKPKEKMLFIPANNSSTGAYQILADNDGKGIIFETEGDTLAHAFKSEHGNYSDGFRKAFHHETISYYRRTDQEYVEIETPCLSTMLSGTPKQVAALIPSAENGLFSRFMFYTMNLKPEWIDAFSVDLNDGLDSYFDNLGNDFYEIFKNLESNGGIRFKLTGSQKKEFNKFFREKQAQYICLQGISIASMVRRSGLIAFRIAMILSVLRIMETGDISDPLVCRDEDFKSAMAMVNVLLKHSDKVYTQMPKEEVPQARKNIQQQFLDALPKNFDRKTYVSTAEKLKIKEKTAENYIKKFVESGLLDHPRHNQYVNLQIPDTEQEGT